MLRKSLLIGALTLAACDPNAGSEADFKAGIPTHETVRVRTPGATGQGLEAQAEVGVSAFGQGDLSTFYVFTRGATDLVNGSTALVLGLVGAITDHPPTSIEGDTAVWGPHSEALKPNAWRLTVTKTGDTTYAWKLDAKGKTQPDSAFVTVLSGDHTAAKDADGKPVKAFGSGKFLFDFDAAQTLPEHDANAVGTFEVTYSRVSATADVSVIAAFRDIAKDGNVNQRVDADYRYVATPGGGGSFDFAWDDNIDAAITSRPLEEHMTIRSRWNAAGAGRADVKASGGELTAPATANECWNANYQSQVLVTSWSAANNYGDPSTCAFTTAEYSQL